MSPTLRRAVVWLAGLALMAATARLGVWQMDRAAQKTALHEQTLKQSSSPVPDFSSFVATKKEAIAKSWENDFQRPSVAIGQWLPQHTVLLDNRQMDGRPGFFVLTPILLDGAKDAQGRPLAIMVQRGWLPRDFMQRDRVPDVLTPPGLQRVPVRIAPPPARLLELGAKPTNAVAASASTDAPNPASASRIRQNLDLAQFASAWPSGFDQPQLIPSATLLQTSSAEQAAPDGLKRDWPQAASGVAKHHGYAAQWFGLCALTAVLLLWFQVIAPRRSKKNA